MPALLPVWPVPGCKVPIMMAPGEGGEGEPDAHHDEAPGEGEPSLAPGESQWQKVIWHSCWCQLAPPTLLFKLHLNPSDFLGWTRQDRIHTYLPQNIAALELSLPRWSGA